MPLKFPDFCKVDFFHISARTGAVVPHIRSAVFTVVYDGVGDLQRCPPVSVQRQINAPVTVSDQFQKQAFFLLGKIRVRSMVQPGFVGLFFLHMIPPPKESVRFHRDRAAEKVRET